MNAVSTTMPGQPPRGDTRGQVVFPWRAWAVTLAALFVLAGLVASMSWTVATARRVSDLEDVVNSQAAAIQALTSSQDDAALQVAEAVKANIVPRIDKAESAASEVQSNLDAVVRCINDYMDTVAQSGGGRYTYYRCRPGFSFNLGGP